MRSSSRAVGRMNRLSKIIKSGQCVETHPRQLLPVDVVYFIDDEETVQEGEISETGESNHEQETPIDQDLEEATIESEGEETVTDPQEPEAVADEVVVTINSADRKRLASVLLDYEDKPETKSKVRNEKPLIDSMAAKVEAATGKEPDAINLDHLADVAASIDSLFSGAKEQAGAIAEHAQVQAGTIIEGASRRAGETLEQAKRRADEITFGAEHKAGSVMGQANQQAETIINSAKDQADLILEGTRQKVEKSFEKAEHQAEVIIENAQKEAAIVVEDTQKQTATMLEEAREQSIIIKEQAHQDGLTEGRQEALTIVRQELATNLTQALTLINEIETERMQRLTSSEPELIKLAVTIAEKIIGEELKLDPVCQLQIIREALARVTTANMLTIRIHPEDLQVVHDNLGLLQSSFNEPKPIKVAEDCNITKGSCFIETDHGNLDARVKSQLERVMAELLKVGKVV